MDEGQLFGLGLVFVVGFLLLLLRSIRQVQQWEVALKFTAGKYTGTLSPGLNFVLPLVQALIRVDTRTRNRDLPRQMVITRDNVTAMIDAVIYFKVVDAEKAALNVQNYENAVRDRAKVVLRDVVGEITLDQLLGHRDEVATRVRAQVEQFVAQWGLHVELIALQDILLPENMQEAIARKAIAERDKQYVIIKSQADVESARNFAEAAKILAESPGAMELRRLEALQGITGSGVSKVVFDLARPDVGGGAAQAQAPKAAASTALPDNVRAQVLAVAEAASEATGVRVDASAPPAAPASDPIAAANQSAAQAFKTLGGVPLRKEED